MVTIMHLQATNRTDSMLRITTEKKRGKVILGVEGRLAGPWVAALEQCWRELRGGSPREKFQVDLCGVSFIDAAGKAVIKEIHRQGGQLIAEGCLNQAIVHEIVAGEKQGASMGTKERPKRSHIIFYTIFFSLLLGPTVTHAHGANRDPDGRPKRTGQEHCAGGFAAASECEDFGRSAESKPAGAVRRQDAVPRSSEDAGTVSSVCRGPELRRAGVRPDAVAEISSSASHGQRQQGEQPFDQRASDSAGGFAVHRDAARSGQRGGIAIARES